MCKRTTTDPLVRMFLDRYGLNLLSIPREKAAVGDLYVFDGRRTSAPGNVSYFLDSPVELPSPTKGEHMADVAGEISDAVSLKAGLGLLEGFLAALGAAAIVGNIRAGYERQKAESLRFHLDDATRDFVDTLQFGRALAGRRLAEDHPMWSESNEYFLVTAVARTRSITVVAKDDRSRTVDVDVDALKVATASTDLTVEGSSDVGVTYRGARRLAFGVELLKLSFDPARQSIALSIPEEGVPLRSGDHAPGAPLGRDFIGPPDADAFLYLA